MTVGRAARAGSLGGRAGVPRRGGIGPWGLASGRARAREPVEKCGSWLFNHAQAWLLVNHAQAWLLVNHAQAWLLARSGYL